MNCEVIIDPNTEEKIIIYAKENIPLIDEIKRLAGADPKELYGYKDREAVRLETEDIYCVTVMENKIYAICQTEKYLLKERLYTLEEMLPRNFVKINKSCIANLNKVERFDASFSGTLKLKFKNGWSDYVSRRQLKHIKERIGI